MGDHTETLEIDFDSRLISFEDIVRLFWNSHNPARGTYKGRQYLSLFLYRDEEEKDVLLSVRASLSEQIEGNIGTELQPFTSFTCAEQRHQKYYLKRYPKAWELLQQYYGTEQALVDSTLVARLNSFVKGYGTLASLKEEINTWEIHEKDELLRLVRELKW